MVYTAMKNIIDSGVYDRDDILNKLDIFLLADRITKEQYDELTGLVRARE